jgi:VanZ family protein
VQTRNERASRIGSAFWAFIAGFSLAIFLVTISKSGEVTALRFVALTITFVTAVVNVFRQIFKTTAPTALPQPVVHLKGEDGIARNEFGEPIEN